MTSLEESQQFTPDLTAMLNFVKLTQHLTQDLKAIPVELPDGLRPLRQWLNGLQIRNATLAHFICRIIPAQCPFARDLDLFGLLSVHIPPLCKLNPLYDEVVSLRFRAVCYLADECNNDVRHYC